MVIFKSRPPIRQLENGLQYADQVDEEVAHEKEAEVDVEMLKIIICNESAEPKL